MHINKFKKLTGGKYKIYFDNKEIILYEDIIIKYKLLIKRDLTEEELSEILLNNDQEKEYIKCLKYVSIKMRSKKEIMEYLKKNNISDYNVKIFMERLTKLGLINDLAYAKAYVSDKLNLTSSGPYKIKKELQQNDIDESIIDNLLDNYQDFVKEKLVKYIQKKQRLNNKRSSLMFKKKMENELISLGYSKNLIIENLSNLNNLNNPSNDEDLLKKEYNKYYQKLSKKYSGEILRKHIKQKLYQAGFSIDLINRLSVVSEGDF